MTTQQNNDEYFNQYSEAVIDFLENKSNDILTWLVERHPNVNPLFILQEWVVSGLLAHNFPAEVIRENNEALIEMYEGVDFNNPEVTIQ